MVQPSLLKLETYYATVKAHAHTIHEFTVLRGSGCCSVEHHIPVLALYIYFPVELSTDTFLFSSLAYLSMRWFYWSVCWQYRRLVPG